MKSMRIEITNGLLLFTSLGGYFLILEALGLTDVIYLRIFNAAIVLDFYESNDQAKVESRARSIPAKPGCQHHHFLCRCDS